MDADIARDIAHFAHRRDRNRHGDAIIDHVERVAASVPPEAQPTAWLHDLLEQSAVTDAELRNRGLTALESAALGLLTRDAEEVYELHALRIAHADGPAGRLARIVKLADLDDHLSRPWTLGDPPYGWARRHIETAAGRLDG